MFTFATAGRIVVGAGASDQVPELAAGLGRRVFVVVGAHTDATAPGLAGLPADTTLWRWSGEPTVAGVRAGVAAARAAAPDVVVGWGGGSVVDLAKSVAILLHDEGDVLDHLEAADSLRLHPDVAACCDHVGWWPRPAPQGVSGAGQGRRAVAGSPGRDSAGSMRHILARSGDGLAPFRGWVQDSRAARRTTDSSGMPAFRR